MMKSIDDELVGEARQYVSLLLTTELSENCVFHTISHTLDVVKHAEIIGAYSGLDENNLNILRVCALFHDVGYVDAYDNHEAFSAKRARSYLKSKNVDPKIIHQVDVAQHRQSVPIHEVLRHADGSFRLIEPEYHLRSAAVDRIRSRV